MDATQIASKEAGKVLDALAAISVQLSCHANAPPHTLVLSASKVRETCDAIDEAVTSLKKILMLTATPQPGQTKSD